MVKQKEFDFCGYVTKNDLKCSDGKIIRANAFKHCDGLTVPLVYNHDHADIDNVLGRVLLENRSDGVYGYGTFNSTPRGLNAKEQVMHGDITSMSIYANQVENRGNDVYHGTIREVSLVLAGANPGARIDYVMAHSDMFDTDHEIDEAIIYTNESIELYHSETNTEDTEMAEETNESKDKTLEEIFNGMTDEQKECVYAMVGIAVDEAIKEASKNTNQNEDEQEDNEVKQNAFENKDERTDVLSHSEFKAVMEDGARYGSLKESFLQHGITNIEYLFPDAKNVDAEPSLISRDMDWVDKFLNGAHHTPFSRIRSLHANITADEARARGYVKGHQKVEEVIVALKRTTTPQTIYKKQALDRDDIIDITDINVVAYVKSEMRVMLNEEIARAGLIGDGRNPLSDDKISEEHIRPIWTDDSLYTINKVIEVGDTATDDEKAKAFIKAALKARKDYKGSGNPVCFTTEEFLTNMLLVEDGIGRRLYPTVDVLKTALRVSDITTVEVMEGATRTVSGQSRELAAIIVNPKDYNYGADNGGSISMFDDFDIDYNKEKYLIETRCSGALIKPYSAIALEFATSASGSVDNEEVTEG